MQLTKKYTVEVPRYGTFEYKKDYTKGKECGYDPLWYIVINTLKDHKGTLTVPWSKYGVAPNVEVTLREDGVHIKTFDFTLWMNEPLCDDLKKVVDDLAATLPSEFRQLFMNTVESMEELYQPESGPLCSPVMEAAQKLAADILEATRQKD